MGKYCEKCGNMFQHYGKYNVVCPDCFRKSHQGKHTPKGRRKWKSIYGLLAMLLLSFNVVIAQECVGGICYDCQEGSLVESNGSYTCVSCRDGFSMVDGQCVLNQVSTGKQTFIDRFLIRYFPNNPVLGFYTITISGIVIAYIILNWKNIKRGIL